MDWNRIKSWLWTEAGAGWIFGLAGLVYFIFNIINEYSKKKKPNIIVCKEIDKFTLIKIYKKVKENTQIFYKDNKIKNLAQIELEVINSGNDVIKNIKIYISFNVGTKILDVVTAKTNDIQGTRSTSDNEMAISLPYLNPYKDYKSKLFLNIVCDGNIDNFNVNGGGKGWSLVHKKLLANEQTTIRLFILIAILFIEDIFSRIFGKYILVNIGNIINIDYFSIIYLLTFIIGTYWAINNSSVKYRFKEKLDNIYKNLFKVKKL